MTKKSIVLYMHVHQPWRINDYYDLFEVGKNSKYFKKDIPNDSNTNGAIFRKVAEKSYRPMNDLLEKLLARHPEFKLSLSITGTFINQAEKYAPEVLESFKRLVKTGRVEIVAETYYHSLAFFFDREEFEAQVRSHIAKIEETFGVTPTAFRNTELSYNDELGQWADKFGFKAILAEGWDPILQWRTPNHVYKPPQTDNIRLLLKNYKLSDDLAFRFSNPNWEEYPLSTGKYISWLNAASYHGDLINLFMDYETFGEHQWAESGIFGFFESFVSEWLKDPNHDFETVSEAAERPPVAEISMPQTVTWADTERDLTAWLGNSMQQEAMKKLYELKPRVYNSHNGEIVEDWRRLQTSDHPYYMCTKYFNDGDVHAYFSSYKSPHDAFLCFMDALRDMDFRLRHTAPLDLTNQKIPEQLSDEKASTKKAKETKKPAAEAAKDSTKQKSAAKAKTLAKKAQPSVPRPKFDRKNLVKNLEFTSNKLAGKRD